MVAYYMVKGLLYILSVLSPILLIVTFIIDREVIWDYGRFIGRLLKERTLVGILAVVLSIVGYPVVAGLLFGRAMLRRTFRKAHQAAEDQQQGSFVEFEEIEEDFLELPKPPSPQKRPADNNDYEQLFD